MTAMLSRATRRTMLLALLIAAVLPMKLAAPRGGGRGGARRPQDRRLYARRFPRPAPLAQRLVRRESWSSWPSWAPSARWPISMPRAWPSWPRISQSQGVAFVGINSNQQDSITEVAVARPAARHSVFRCSRIRPTRSPTALAQCARPKSSCSTRIASCATGGGSTISTASAIRSRRPLRNDLQLALEELLAGKPVSQPTTEAAGLLDRPRQAARAVGRRDLLEADCADSAEPLRRVSSRRADRAVFADQLRRGGRLGGND